MAALTSSTVNTIDFIETTVNGIDITNFESSFRRIQGILDELSFGATYTADDMDKLVKKLYGENGIPTLEDFLEEFPGLFTEMADGVYVVTGNILEAQEQIFEKTANDAYAVFEKVNNTDYDQLVNDLTGGLSLEEYITEQTENKTNAEALIEMLNTTLENDKDLGFSAYDAARAST